VGGRVQDVAEIIQQDHQAILEAIMNRDAAAAQAMMDRHLF
jgi:DNA-binding FadR family transcriptional regulator